MHNTIKLAKQVLAAHKAKLATAADKDSVRRQIAATEQRLRELYAEHCACQKNSAGDCIHTIQARVKR